jgi:phosphoglycerate dehydrogenase-like enzyme
MAEIQKVLAAVPYHRERREQLRKIFAPAEMIFCDPEDRAGILNALQTVDVALLGSDRDDSFFYGPNLKWVHVDHAGLNRIARPEFLNRDMVITGSARRSAPALADHAVYFMLSFTFAFPALIQAQQAHHYIQDPQFLGSLRCLHGQTVGIIGMGNTGKELAVRAKAFGMQVLGYRRSQADLPEGVDRMYCANAGESIDALLCQSDFVVLALPLTNGTYHMISERELSLMKPTACLINIARDAVIDEKALTKALYSSAIGGAGLDTFEKEPLPEDSPLWDAPHTILTPHVTPQMPDRTDRSLAIIEKNVQRYRAGKPMRNQLGEEELFTMNPSGDLEEATCQNIFIGRS